MRNGSARRRWLIASAGAAVIAFLAGVGPWPTYGRRDPSAWAELDAALARLSVSAAHSERDGDPGPLRAGWAAVRVEVPAGTPLAGYARRQGRPAEGERDPIRAKALVLRDDADTIAILSGDLLIVPENVAGRVRERLARRFGGRPESVLFSATHTHSGPGAFAPGWLARQFAGDFDPRVERALVDAFVAAAGAASDGLQPARWAAGRVAAGDLVRNRSRPAATEDADLQFMRFEKADGAACVLVCFAAHATLLGPENMRRSGDYPGRLERSLERDVDLALFVAGAVGSMGPEPPATPAGVDAADAMGDALAERTRLAMRGVEPIERAQIAAAGVAFEMPPVQARLNGWLRFSPLLATGRPPAAARRGTRSGRWAGSAPSRESCSPGSRNGP